MTTRSPALGDLALEPRRDLGGGAVRALHVPAEPQPAGLPLGRPEADARPRRVHRRLGALGQRLVPAHRRARLLLAVSRRHRLLPALPGARRAVRERCSSATTSLAGLVVSLAASLAAFVLLHRLAEERLGAEGARRTVLYLAVFPMSLFLIAVYSESLFLMLARRGLRARRARQVAAGLGARPVWRSLTRIAGVALLPALAFMAWRSPNRRRALAGRRPAGRALLPPIPPTSPRRPADALAVPPLAGSLAPALLLRRAARRDLGRTAGRLGRRSSSSRAGRTRTATGRPCRSPTPTRCARR